jgi:hypothetical protein
MKIALRCAVAALALTLVAGCSSSSTSGDPTTDATGPGPARCPLTVADAWAKAADSGMTAAFARLDNATGSDVTIVTATSPAAAKVELHEVLVGADGSSTMAPKAGGFVIPANGSLTLAPGGYHLMLMQLTGPVRAGDEVAVTMVTADGAHCLVQASARTFDGGSESYAPNASASPMGMSTP